MRIQFWPKLIKLENKEEKKHLVFMLDNIVCCGQPWILLILLHLVLDPHMVLSNQYTCAVLCGILTLKNKVV